MAGGGITAPWFW